VNKPRLLGTLIVLAVLSGCATSKHAEIANEGLNQAPVEFPLRVEGVEGFTQGIYRAGPVFIAGQPTEAALTQMAKEGVSLVVNLRTPEEMSNRERVPFDEAEVLSRLGIEYVYLPMGGPNGTYAYTPEAVDRFAEALARHKYGPVLLHCQVGWRASHMWGAYLYRYRGLAAEEAYRHAKGMVASDQPFEGLAGVQATFRPR